MQHNLKLIDGFDQNQFFNIDPMTLNEAEQGSVIRMALDILKMRHWPGEALTSPAQTVEYLQCLLAGEKNEKLGVIFLDNRNQIIGTEILFTGTVDGCSVYPRNVVARSLEVNASAMCLFHNHPSGVVEPSQADRHITERLRKALALVDIRVLDHMIVGSSASYSFAEHGLI